MSFRVSILQTLYWVTCQRTLVVAFFSYQKFTIPCHRWYESIFGQVNVEFCDVWILRVCLIMFEVMVLGSYCLLFKHTSFFLEWLLYYFLFMYFCGIFCFQVHQHSCCVVLLWTDKYRGISCLEKVLMSEAVLLLTFYFASELYAILEQLYTCQLSMQLLCQCSCKCCSVFSLLENISVLLLHNTC